MSRLQSELRRLYLPDATEGLIDARGQVRALVLELARPADWALLGPVWRGVQQELELPAPAIAVSGTDSFQLWFSLEAPVSAPRAHAFLESLRLRYLPEIPARRLRLMPRLDEPVAGATTHAALVPALQADTGNWSAFVAPDLAPVFADTPWLDIPPGDDGQADVLCRLASIKPAAFEAAWEHLAPPAAPAPEAAPLPAAMFGATEGLDPKRFLQQVMNDAAVPLALRIEAAKALLRHGEGPGAARGG